MAMTGQSAPSLGDPAVRSGTRVLAQAPKWIVCRRAARSVIDDGVFCPRGDLVTWQSCLDCHLLEAVDEDRERGCGELESFEPPIMVQPTSHRLRWPELIIELL
jgi:hypothetical protein